MGLIKGLLLLPMAPVNGLRWVTEVLIGEAERELAERESPVRQLADLDARRATGEISEAEAERLETELIEQMLAHHGSA
jgi:Gas vesicle protein G